MSMVDGEKSLPSANRSVKREKERERASGVVDVRAMKRATNWDWTREIRDQCHSQVENDWHV